MSKISAKTSCQEDILEVLNCIPHGVVLLDEDLCIAGMNWVLEAVTGYAAEDVKGVYGDFVFRSNLGAKGRDLFDKVMHDGEPAFIEGDVINADRRKVPIRFTVSPLKKQACSPAGLIIVFEDISLQSELAQKNAGKDEIKGIIGHCPQLQKLYELLPILSYSDASVLITGETGTGKDLLAEAIHKASKRSGYPFIKVNCGALPETLLESELFGHVRGAFTGANSDKPGMFRLAQKGTLFLTEIGDLPFPLQAKLLTVLDDMEFFPLGSSKKAKVDVRLITGTHRDLRQLVSEGKFREDLFFRLNVLRAHMPPLRERGDDVILLMDHFLQLFVRNLNKNINGFSREAVDILMRYAYPGNVRELRNIVEYAANICQGEMVMPDHLPSYMHSHAGHVSAGASAALKQDAPAVSEHAETEDLSILSSWPEIEKKKILQALMGTGGNRGKAAKILGLGRSTLWRKIKQYGLG